MILSPEQEQAILLSHQAFLAKQVINYFTHCPRYMWQHWDDLMQEASLALLKHIKQIDSLSKATRCHFKIRRALREYVREMALVSIAYDQFSSNIGKFQRVDLDLADVYEGVSPEDDVLSKIAFAQWLSVLSDKQQSAVFLKLKGAKNKELITVLGMTYPMEVTRWMKMLRANMSDHLDL